MGWCELEGPMLSCPVYSYIVIESLQPQVRPIDVGMVIYSVTLFKYEMLDVVTPKNVG